MKSDASSREEPTVTFHRVYPGAIPPMRADKAALGIIPSMAFRHCEPIRAASSYGWYIFPPEDTLLRWNGSDVFHLVDGEWQPLNYSYLPGFPEYWDQNAPAELAGLAPRYLSRLQLPGLVQVWSGLLCSARDGWSVLVRPPVNMRGSYLYSCYEGMVDADRFKPFPLFMNIQLITPNVVIKIPKLVPFFQVQPVQRSSYGELGHRSLDIEGLEPDENGLAPMSAGDWAGFRNTIRVEASDEGAESGRYTAATRKRNKHED